VVLSFFFNKLQSSNVKTKYQNFKVYRVMMYNLYMATWIVVLPHIMGIQFLVQKKVHKI